MTKADRETAAAERIFGLLPLLRNNHAQGRSWREHGIRSEQVLARNAQIGQGSEALWVYAQTIIADAVNKGCFDA